jgi:D-serine deaminase-like pyridoxal phosphate-dependent protein
MDSQYLLHDPSQVHSPALLFYRDVIRQNIDGLIARVGGDPKRLRPHVKTHKTREIAQMQLRAGITNHKCATIAEAEMLAGVGAADVLLAYNLVGPNCGRLAKLIEKHRGCRFSTLVDHPIAAQGLSDVMSRAGQTVDVLLDVDVGQHRTGIAPGGEAVRLYETLTRLPGLAAGGLHVYDGHNHQHNLEERRQAANRLLTTVSELRAALAGKGLPVPRIVLGGTPTFPVYAELPWAEAECSPGTCVLNDANYAAWFADLGEFKHAALLLTRVISRPTPRRVTFDLGYKAVASDPPTGKRCMLWDVPDAEAVLHNEEHLVIETPAAERFRPGDTAYAVPAHICPTVALHRFAYVVEDGQVVDRWEIEARDRMLTL